jgi:hypothetical protein
MIEFKKNVKELLPYNRRQYILGDRVQYVLGAKWYGVAFQLPGVFEGRVVGLKKFVEVYESWFKNIISRLDNGSFWIVNHDGKDYDWFPNDDDTLADLRTLFKQNNIPNTFRGALIFTKDDLLKFSRDLLSYPCGVLSKDGLLYDNLDISHSELPFIIKISSGWDISLLSTNKEILREVVNENSLSLFIVRQYRGTSL